MRGIFRCKIKELVRSPVEDDSSRRQHNHPVIPISEVINLIPVESVREKLEQLVDEELNTAGF